MLGSSDLKHPIAPKLIAIGLRIAARWQSKPDLAKCKYNKLYRKLYPAILTKELDIKKPYALVINLSFSY